MKIIGRLLGISLLLIAGAVQASETIVKNVEVNKVSTDTYRFSVTLAHPDKSWDHYANIWQVETVSGEIIAKRILLHPHINEQPFTRSLSGVVIDSDVKEVVIVAGCTVDGIHSNKFTIALP